MLCRLAGAFRLLFAAHGAKPGAVGTAKQHRGDLEHEFLAEPLIHIQMPFFIQRKLEIRVIQIPFLDGPLRIDCLFPGDRVQAAGALSVHRCVCPQCGKKKAECTCPPAEQTDAPVDTRLAILKSLLNR